MDSFFKKSDIDKLTEWSMIPACPSLICFFNRSNTEGTNFSKKMCLMFVCVFFLCVCVCVGGCSGFFFGGRLCQDGICGFGIICGLMTWVQSK